MLSRLSIKQEGDFTSQKKHGHIRKDHPQVELEEIETVIKNPTKLFKITDDKYYYFHYFKHKNLPKKFLRAIVNIKTLNGL